MLLAAGADGVFVLKPVLRDAAFFPFLKKLKIPADGPLVLKLRPKPLYVKMAGEVGRATFVQDASWQSDQWLPNEKSILDQLDPDVTDDPSKLARYRKRILPDVLASEVTRYRRSQVALMPQNRPDFAEEAHRRLRAMLAKDLELITKDMQKNSIVDGKPVFFWTVASRTAEPKAKLPDFEKAIRILKSCETDRLDDAIKTQVSQARSAVEAARDQRTRDEPALAEMAVARAGKPLGPNPVHDLAKVSLMLRGDEYVVPSESERKVDRALAKRVLTLASKDATSGGTPPGSVVVSITRYATPQDAARKNQEVKGLIRSEDLYVVEGPTNLREAILGILAP
jgi:hypothetical protein